jgi:hypothetical protein
VYLIGAANLWMCYQSEPYCHVTLKYIYRYYNTKENLFLFAVYYLLRGPGSSVGIATDYGLDGPEIESRWEARFFAPV